MEFLAMLKFFPHPSHLLSSFPISGSSLGFFGLVAILLL